MSRYCYPCDEFYYGCDVVCYTCKTEYDKNVESEIFFPTEDYIKNSGQVKLIFV